MKRLMNLVTIIALLFSFSACNELYFYYYDYDNLKETVVMIELIRYNNEAKEYSNIKEEDILPFEFNKMEMIEVLSEDKMEKFWELFKNMRFVSGGRGVSFYDSPSGICIRMIYENGDFEIFTEEKQTFTGDKSYACSFYANGEVKKFIGAAYYTKKLINQLFDINS